MLLSMSDQLQNSVVRGSPYNYSHGLGLMPVGTDSAGGSVYTANTFDDTSSMFIAGYAPDGTPLWSWTAGASVAAIDPSSGIAGATPAASTTPGTSVNTNAIVSSVTGLFDKIFGAYNAQQTIDLNKQRLAAGLPPVNSSALFQNKMAELQAAQANLINSQASIDPTDSAAVANWQDAYNKVSDAISMGQTIQNSIASVEGWYQDAVNWTADQMWNVGHALGLNGYPGQRLDGLGSLGFIQAAAVGGVIASIAAWLAIAAIALAAAYAVINSITAPPGTSILSSVGNGVQQLGVYAILAWLALKVIKG